MSRKVESTLRQPSHRRRLLIVLLVSSVLIIKDSVLYSLSIFLWGVKSSKKFLARDK